MLNWDDYGKEEKATSAIIEKVIEPKPSVPHAEKSVQKEVQPVQQTTEKHASTIVEGSRAEAARKAVNDSNLGESENLILLMPKIIEGAQSKLASIGLTDSDEAIKVINVIVNSMVKSVNGRNQYLPDNSVDSGLTANETIFKKITTGSVSNLDEAGLSSSDIGKASSELVGTVVSSLGSGGISSSELGALSSKLS